MVRAGVTVERLTLVAAELADEVGFEKLTVSALARRFGVKDPSLYAHIKNAQDLWVRVATLALAELADRVAAAPAGRAGKDALVAFANAYRDQFPVAGPLSKQLADAGLPIPMMGGDGIADKQYVALGGQQGDLATGIGAPVESAQRQDIHRCVRGSGLHRFVQRYGPLTYDSTNVIINALAKAVRDEGFSSSRRQELVDAVQQIDGASGKVAFDEYGDTTNKVLTVYTVQGDNFGPVTTGTFTEQH